MQNSNDRLRDRLARGTNQIRVSVLIDIIGYHEVVIRGRIVNRGGRGKTTLAVAIINTDVREASDITLARARKRSHVRFTISVEIAHEQRSAFRIGIEYHRSGKRSVPLAW